jgi:rhodanese-related sulfurtransferase
MAIVARQREYGESAMDAGGALDYFQGKMAFTTGPVELTRAIANGEVNVVDVRLEEDYRAGHIPGATNLPQDRWHTFEGLVRDRPNVLMCYSHVCHLAAHAAVEFAPAGYPVMELDGGWKEWQRHNLPVERKTQ